MSNVMQRIANYFQNDYEGVDETAPTFAITVEELREIAGINTERCRLLAQERATYKPALQKLEKIEKVVDVFDSIENATFDDYEDLVDDLYMILGK